MPEMPEFRRTLFLDSRSPRRYNVSVYNGGGAERAWLRRRVNKEDRRGINMDQGKQTKEKAEKLAAMKKLSTSKELFVLMSLCTKMPFVMCDPETFDDEVFLYEKEEDIKREGQRFLDQKIPLQIAKIDNKQFLHFYSNLFTMGVNCLVFNGYMEDEYKLQLADLMYLLLLR